MNSEQTTEVETSATKAEIEEASVTNTIEMDNNDNLQRIVQVASENIAKTTRTSNRSNDNDYWAEIENEDLILNLGPPPIVVENATEQISATAVETSPSNLISNSTLTSISTNATTVESVTSRLLRKRDELAKKYGIGEGKHEQTDNKVDLSETNNGVETSVRREQTLEEFKEDLRLKRLARQTAVQDLRNEIHTLRSGLVETGAENVEHDVLSLPTDIRTDKEKEKLCLNNLNTDADMDADDEDPMSRSRHANIELANAQLALQMANAENLSLNTELATVQKQVVALKEVVTCCKQMLAVKEDQCAQLKSKLDEIESSLAERELKLMSNHLRVEYERQLENIRQLRELYEERQRISAAEHENLQRLISIKRDEVKAEQEKTKSVEERNQLLLKELENANKELQALREECDEHKFEKKALKEEIGAVNTLFSQMLTGFNGKDNLDIDRLTTMLEENRTLLNDMATKEMANDGATLPKLLFELVEQAAVASEKNTSRSTSPVSNDDDVARDVDAVDNAAEANVDTKTNMLEATAIREGAIEGESAVDKYIAAPDVKNDDEGTTAICYGTLEETTSLQATLSSSPHPSSSATTTTTPSTMSTGTCASGLDATKNVRKHYRRTTPTKATDANTTTTSKIAGKTMKFAEPEVIGKVVSTQEIIGNLPKVWKVLMELLSHHKIERVQFEENGSGEDCYKAVQTANGIKTELSVSKTYIKLKDLILEKKSLVKETNRLKTLNCHLEYRLNEQEKRLSTVSLELTKTWHLVGKMQRQHRQLHTQEQILRYQLQQKRRLLSELKDELEYCRRKWALARAKNDESMEQCNDLRREFAKRKLEDANNSTESGYSDSGPPSEDETAAALSSVGNCRRKILREMFEHTRKIKRMQSTSPRRAIYNMASEFDTRSVTLLRCNSAPPSLGCRVSVTYEYDNDDVEPDEEDEDFEKVAHATASKGAIPKATVPRAASIEKDTVVEALEPEVHACRIHRLEEQCKSLIEQVMETSDNRERLEKQLCRLQGEIVPQQHGRSIDSFDQSIQSERMTRASSAPASGCLTAREEEYTRKRSERLGRLEEESKQLLSRIRRTADRGHYLRCSLDRIRRAPSREGSLESNAEEDKEEIFEPQNVEAMEAHQEGLSSENLGEKCPLTSKEKEYTARRSERLKRLEEESKALLNRVSLHNERTEEITGPTNNIETRIHNIDRISENRNERLRILEEEGKALLIGLSNTSARGTVMINRIAEREQRVANSQKAQESENDKENVLKESAEAAYIEPIPNNVASTSIASHELTDGLVITTTPSQIGIRQGAIPKTSKPNAQLSLSRGKSSKRSADSGSLEALVKSLQNLPFPDEAENQKNEKRETKDVNQGEKSA